MANPNRNTTGQFMYSPAEDIDTLPSPGAHSNPSAPSYSPDVDMTDKSGDAAPQSSPAESYGGMSETVSPGGAVGAAIANGAVEPQGDMGDMAGGLGDVPKPSGSY